MTEADRVAEIAGSLTEAQRDALKQDLRYVSGESIMQRCPSATFAWLQRTGLADGACLTDLGKAVRAHLARGGR